MGLNTLQRLAQSCSRFVKLLSSAGSGLGVNGFQARSSSLRVEMLPRKGGTVPLSRFPAKFKVSRRWNPPKLAGMSPEKLLAERSKCLRLGIPAIDSGRGPAK